jgi:hypothetical protein
VLEGLSTIYRDLDADLGRLEAACSGCGDCCHLGAYGHELWLTNLELAALVAATGARAPVVPGVCPYLEDGHCAARNGRALSCRIFHCDLERSDQERLHEAYLTRVTRLAEETGVSLAYGELLASLAALATSAKTDQSGSMPLTNE